MINRHENDLVKVLNEIDTGSEKYHGMTYEQGIEMALMWVLGEIPEEEFEYSKL